MSRKHDIPVMSVKMPLLLALNLVACIACLIISLNILIYGPIMIEEPNIYIVITEVFLASITILLNVNEGVALYNRKR